MRFQSWLDVLFPPLCALCQERTRNLLCPDCQEHLAPPDPSIRCRHCFVEMESRNPLCSRCARSPLLRAPRAYLFDDSPVASAWKSRLLQDEALYETAASLLVMQWGRLAWPFPDRIAIVPTPGKTGRLRSIGESVASLLKQSLSPEFGLQWVSFFEWRIKRVSKDLLEGQSLLLIDFDSSARWLSKALSLLWPAYPKEVYILCLFAEKPDKR